MEAWLHFNPKWESAPTAPSGKKDVKVSCTTGLQCCHQPNKILPLQLYSKRKSNSWNVMSFSHFQCWELLKGLSTVILIKLVPKSTFIRQ